MTTTEIILPDEQTRELTPTMESPTLFGSSDPGVVVERASAVSKALMAVVQKQGLSISIDGKSHLKVEAWTMMGSMVGVFPVVVWTHPIKEDGATVGWEARVEAVTRTGAVVGAAESMCARSESKWKTRDDYALRSMAQTRATSKALATCLRFVAVLAGYAGTPAEDMPSGDSQGGSAPRNGTPSTQRQATQPKSGKGAKCPFCAEKGWLSATGLVPSFWMKGSGPNQGKLVCNGRLPADENGKQGYANHFPPTTDAENAAAADLPDFNYERP
jgi:hypothetical protein